MGILVPLRALAPYALGALGYLFRDLLSPSPVNAPIQDPYTPPFTGGQCVGVNYRVHILMAYNGNYNQFPYRWSYIQAGAIRPPLIIESSDSFTFTLGYPDGTRITGENFDSARRTWKIEYVERQDGQPDNVCGDIPNPNPAKSIPDTGITNAPSPNLDNSTVVIEGSPIVKTPNFLQELLSALALARDALNALDAIRNIADAIQSLSNLLEELRKKLDSDREKDSDENKEISRYDFGSISKDGYLRLYPSSALNKKRAIYLDVQVLTLPTGIGKQFGVKSPHFYKFRTLGYIAFTSPTFGIMELRQIEFTKSSIPIPENASGFYYHLGLDGSITANVSGFYQQTKTTL